jgi:uncharacterized membrane protein
MGGGCAYGAMPRKAMQVILIYKGLSHLYKLVFITEGLHVFWLCLSSLGISGIQGDCWFAL